MSGNANHDMFLRAIALFARFSTYTLGASLGALAVTGSRWAAIAMGLSLFSYVQLYVMRLTGVVDKHDRLVKRRKNAN